MRAGMYIIPPETTSPAYLRNPVNNSINTTASEIVEVIPLILPEYQKQSSFYLVCRRLYQKVYGLAL
jgi:hypothetical protein